MLTAKTQYNLQNAREYFEEHLCVGDYYDEGQRVSGEWLGAGVKQLGLSGKVRADDFLRLCENQHPATGGTLTQRLNTVRTENGKEAVNRRVFYDFTFSPPKSVSVAALAGADERIIEAHSKAVRSALRELEAFAFTRVRVNGGHGDRSTGNFAAALFTHDTSRALDPHLHTHCVIFNATFDPVEQHWKALQNYELLQAKKFAENAYYHELARQLRNFGYQIRNSSRGDFQIEGISEAICDRFSKRDAQIDQALTDLLANKPELAEANLKELRAKLAVKTRAQKQKDLSRAELRTLWDAQLSHTERASLRQLTNQSAKITLANKPIALDEAVQWAEDHLFDRNSVVLECQLWQQALERARGGNFTLAELKELTHQRNYVRNPERPNEVTLRDVLLREMEIVETVSRGFGTLWSRKSNPVLNRDRSISLHQLVALACGTVNGQVEQRRRDAGTEPARNDRQRAAGGSPPRLRLSADACS